MVIHMKFCTFTYLCIYRKHFSCRTNIIRSSQPGRLAALIGFSLKFIFSG